MKILVTGITGYIGSHLAPRLADDGHDVIGFSRRSSTGGRFQVRVGDAVTGAGLAQALEGVETAYYLMHSMEPSVNGSLSGRENHRQGLRKMAMKPASSSSESHWNERKSWPTETSER